MFADMLGRSNLIALIGGGQAPKFPDRNGELACTACVFYFHAHVTCYTCGII